MKKQPVRQGRYTNISKTRKAKRSVRRRWNWFWRLTRKQKIAVIATPILLFLVLTPLLTYLFYANDISDKERLMNRNNTGIVLKDVNDQPFFSVGRAQHRTIVPLDQISKPMKDALIASEDKDFYQHGGFSLASIFRAMFTNISAGSMNAYGGSTLTQQLAKNTLLSDNKSFLRKYQELAVSIAIEQKYTKDEILDMYLNSVFYGENSFGIEDAAKTYFGKAPKDLTLAESAMLVGVLPAPSAYSPISGNSKYAKERQETVLTRMVNNGFITADQKKAALAEELQYVNTTETQVSPAPHFAEMVIKELQDKYGEERVMRSGYQVKTTLDLNVQSILQKNLSAGMPHINTNGGSNASGVVIDPKTGEILALVGSADWNDKTWGKVNMVTTARQPGSSFKPIYYAYALDQGVINPSMILHDVKTDFGGGYSPSNADRKFRGDVSVRNSLSQSLNIPSIEVMQKFGITKSIDAANKIGITSIDKSKDYGLALALGSAEAPLQQMTNAYAAFANGGQQFNNSSIKEIDDKFGKQIFTQSEKSKQVIGADGAYLISSILSDNSARAPIFGSSLTVRGHTVAVKTGTTNDNRDAWTIGYNPEYAVGVWVGNNNNEQMRSGGSDMAGPIWRGTMNNLLQGKQNVEFSRPSTIVERATCKSNGGLSSGSGNGTYNEFYKSGALPTNTCEPEPTMIDVCNLDTMKVESIDEKKIGDGNYSRNASDCTQKQIQVCDTTSNRIVTINESEFDSTKYSRETANCGQQSVGQIQACDIISRQIVMIDQSEYNANRYSRDLTRCSSSNSPAPNR